MPPTPEATPAAPEAPAAPATEPTAPAAEAPAAPATPPKYWDRFENEAAAKAHYENLEKDYGAKEAFVKQVSPLIEHRGDDFYWIGPALKNEPEKPATEPAFDPLDPASVDRRIAEGMARTEALRDSAAEERANAIASFKGKYDLLDDHVKELDAAFKRLPVEQRAQKGSYANALQILRGRDMDKIIETHGKRTAEALKKDAKAIEGAAVDTKSGKPVSSDTLPELSEVEKRTAHNLGIAEATYAKRKAEMAAERKPRS